MHYKAHFKTHVCKMLLLPKRSQGPEKDSGMFALLSALVFVAPAKKAAHAATVTVPTHLSLLLKLSRTKNESETI